MKRIAMALICAGILSACGNTGSTTDNMTGGANGSITFSSPSGFNGDSSTLTPSVVLPLGALGLQGTAPGATVRTVQITVVGAVEGQTYPVSAEGTSVAYTETSAGATKIWQQNTGSVKVLKASAGKLGYQLLNVTMTKSTDGVGTNAATGTFTLNGTLNN